MEKGRDFYEYKAVRETKNAVIELVFPRDIGNVEIDEPSFSIVNRWSELEEGNFKNRSESSYCSYESGGASKISFQLSS